MGMSGSMIPTTVCAGTRSDPRKSRCYVSWGDYECLVGSYVYRYYKTVIYGGVQIFAELFCSAPLYLRGVLRPGTVYRDARVYGHIKRLQPWTT